MNFSQYTVSQKGLFSHGYEIRDGDYIAYTAKRSFFFRKCVLYADDGSEIFIIRRHFAFFQLKFTIEYQDDIFATVISKGAFSNGLKISVEQDAYEVKSSLLLGEFTIFKNLVEIAKISRKKFALKNKIGIAIQEGEDDELILAIVFVIEMMIRVRKSKSG